MLEGEGNFILNGTGFCKISKGRVVIASEDGENLLRSRRLKLVVTKPTRISFSGNRIESVGLSDGFHKKPDIAGASVFSGSELIVDDQLAKYVIHVSLIRN